MLTHGKHFLQIRIQPDTKKTLHDPGVCTYQHQMNDEQYWGLLMMAFVYFGGESDNMEIVDHSSSRCIPGKGREMKLAYLAYAKGNYMLSYDPDYDSNRNETNWIDYFASYQRHIPLPHCPIADDDDSDDTTDTLRKKVLEMELYDYFTAYFCRLVGKGDMIVRFHSLEFLQGCATFLSWFSSKPERHIYYVHHNTKRVDVQFP